MSTLKYTHRQGGQRPFENRLGLQATKDLEDILAETVPHLSIHKVSSQVATLMTSSCSAHTHSLPSPAPVVSWLGVLEEHRGRWRALTRGTQTLETIDFVHTLPIVYTRVALAFIHLQFTMHTFETCTNGPHMQFRQNKGAFQPRKHTCAEIAKAPVSMSSSSKSSL